MCTGETFSSPKFLHGSSSTLVMPIGRSIRNLLPLIGRRVRRRAARPISFITPSEWPPYSPESDGLQCAGHFRGKGRRQTPSQSRVPEGFLAPGVVVIAVVCRIVSDVAYIESDAAKQPCLVFLFLLLITAL